MRNELYFPADIKYTAEHIWAKKDGEYFLIGISDFAQDQLGEIVFIEVPSIGENFTAEQDFGTVESLKSVNKLFMPFAASIAAVNNQLEDKASLVNSDCYNQGWIIKVSPKNAEDYQKMLDQTSYQNLLG